MLDAIIQVFGRLGQRFGLRRSGSSEAIAVSEPKRMQASAIGPSAAVLSMAEPHGRVRDEWDPSLVRTALRLADSGDFRLVSDLCDTLLGDDRIASVFETRINGVFSNEPTFEPSSYGNSRNRNRASKALDLGADWWSIFPEEELARMLRQARLAGLAFGRLVPTRREEHGNRVIPRLEVWSLRWFKFDHKLNQWYRQQTDGEWIPFTPNDGEWVMYAPNGGSRPWAFGLWRGLSVLYLLKKYALADWANYSERHGGGTWAIEGAADPKVRKELSGLFFDLSRNAAVALPPGVTAELIEAKANTWENFSAQIQTANIGFAVMVIGGNLAAEVDKNQQTGATAQSLVRLDYKRSDASSLSSFCHDKVLVWWAYWNFGNAQLAPWPIWQVEPKEDARATADTWFVLAQAISKLNDSGYGLDVNELIVRFNIPLIKTESKAPELPSTTQTNGAAQ